MNRIRCFTAVLSAALFTAQSEVPITLRPPANQRLLFQAHGRGDQVYTCKVTPDSASWSFKAPEAQLLDKDGALLGRHFAGPTWQAEDGSRVVGEVAATKPSPDPDAIPWLLLHAKEHHGSGAMSKVLTIQRVDTKGGKVPLTGCDASHSGADIRVPYQAEYLFFGSAQ